MFIYQDQWIMPKWYINWKIKSCAYLINFNDEWNMHKYSILLPCLLPPNIMQWIIDQEIAYKRGIGECTRKLYQTIFHIKNSNSTSFIKNINRLIYI